MNTADVDFVKRSEDLDDLMKQIQSDGQGDAVLRAAWPRKG